MENAEAMLLGLSISQFKSLYQVKDVILRDLYMNEDMVTGLAQPTGVLAFWKMKDVV